ncbi:MAG: hypothetical protein FWC79_00005, partial [Oscillospiraceae bacterium]|nr:hypothetical protein [Oscillospiraceae bacterium]
ASELGIAVGHAGVFTTAEDFLKVLTSLINDKYMILNKESIERMLEHDELYALRPYNYSGTRYRNPIPERDEIPIKASDNSIIFSGFTGPIFLIDFERKIIVLVMTNSCHNSSKDRKERYILSQKMIEELYDDVLQNR